MVRHEREWFAAHAGAPGVEVHKDPDIVWKLVDGIAWLNAGVSLRFTTITVERRLDEIVGAFAKHGRGCGFWVDVDATPADLEEHLKKRRLRCRKYFAGMACDLKSLPEVAEPPGIAYERVTDDAFRTWGKINTPIRRLGYERTRHLVKKYPDRVTRFAALEG